MTSILIDTDILIDIANNDELAKNRLIDESRNSTLVVSVITVMELTVGCRNKIEIQNMNRFLTQFQIVTLTPQISNRAIQLLRNYYLSHGLLIPDALIAASAIEQKIPLLSKNQRDFRFIQDLNLLTYP
ncbi:MAG: type II toxin-antitoxin system VapC family toxin [Prochlorotrichaceae cyanobacterium]|jgi:predicted nucleic acid-binding protein